MSVIVEGNDMDTAPSTWRLRCRQCGAECAKDLSNWTHDGKTWRHNCVQGRTFPAVPPFTEEQCAGLKFYESDTEWAIARSREEAFKFIVETGMWRDAKPEDIEECIGSPGSLEECNPDELVHYFEDDPSMFVFHGTKADFIRRHGPGYVGSTEW